MINKLILFGMILYILFVFHYPDVIAISNTPKDMVYLGQNSYFDPWDVNLYISVIKSGQLHGLKLENLYTPIPNTPVYVYTFLTALGVIFKTSNPFLIFHISGLAAGIILLLGMFYLVKSLGLSFRKSLLTIFLVSLGGGLGFLGISSADIASSAFTFYSTFQKAHEAIATLALISAHILFFKTVTQKFNYSNITLLTISLATSLFIYPYFIVSFFLICGLFLVFYYRKKKDFDKYILLVGLAIPSAIVAYFSASQFIINPSFGNVGNNLSLNIISVILGYGILIPIFIYQLFWLPKSQIRSFLSIWFLITLILAILPFGPGKIFFRGSFFPITLLAVMSLSELFKLKPKLNKNIVYGVFVLLMLGTSTSIFFSRISESYKNNPWTYMPVEEYKILGFLNNETKTKSSVLTFFRLGNQIPAFTHNRVYFGHFLQTPDGSNKINKAAMFIGGKGSVKEKREFLANNKIDYFIWGQEEENLYEKNNKEGNEIKDLLKTLKIVYKSANFTIFATK